MGNRTPGRVAAGTPVAAPPPPLPPIARNNNPPPLPPQNNNAVAALLFQNQDPYLTAIQASMAEAPLPLGWDEASTSKGVIYYIDHVNGVTTFQDPRLAGATPNTNRKKKKKKEQRLPKYKRDLYSKLQGFLVRLHQRQQDEGQLQITVSRENLLVDSFQFISILDALTLTRRLFIKFEGEDGLDYGGMSREWFLSLSEKILSPELKLFRRCPSGYYQIDRFSTQNKEHLEYFRFVGTIMGMAFYHGKIFYSHFGLPFYKDLLERPLDVTDLQYEDDAIYKGIKKIEEAEDVDSWDLDFTITEKDEDGKHRVVYLKKDQPDLLVTNENKKEYIDAVLKHYFRSTEEQMRALCDAFYQFVPLEMLKEFESEELEQIMVGTKDMDLNDLKSNTEYGEGYSESNLVVRMFWEVMGTLTQEELKSFLQFTTGSNKVPVGGFSHLYGSKGPQKFTIVLKKTPGLPTAHSCFNRLELPQYADKEKLKKDILYAITETQGFGLE